MDFFEIRVKEPKGKSSVHTVFADFVVGRSKDLMVKGGTVHAVWDDERGLWCASDYDVAHLVDVEVRKFADRLKEEDPSKVFEVQTLRSFESQRWLKFKAFMKSLSDNYQQLDAKLMFANTEIKRTDYATRRLSYSLERGPCPAYHELVGTLYSEGERRKFEWAIGAVIAGESREIEKFLVFHGSPGTGKGTVLKIIELLMEGYSISFDAAALTSSTNQFGLSAFKDNPIVAIQHDGDLSKIEDNTRLNSLVSHEKMRVNEKFKPDYDSKITSFLFMGTNHPVKITDARSGLIRRLIDVYPSGIIVNKTRYDQLVPKLRFELGAIAHHCLDVYRSLGKNAFEGYKPTAMLFKTNIMFNFIEASRDVFEEQNGTSLTQAYKMYKQYCDDASVEYKMKLHLFREELRAYFDEYHDRIMIKGVSQRSYFSGFRAVDYKTPVDGDPKTFILTMNEEVSLLDDMLAASPAQYAKANGTPQKYWDDSERLIGGILKKPDSRSIATTVLSDLDTKKLHYVKLPANHIVIDFDLTDDDGNKSLELNKIEASKWPATYAEVSKSGQGVHLHYIYTGGDPSELSRMFAEGIEVKVYKDNSALRRMLTKCNDIEVASIAEGLPKERKMLTPSIVQTEQRLRDLIKKNLRKEIHPGTKPSIDFIAHLLDEAHRSGVDFDLGDLAPSIMAFANNSEKNADYCLGVVSRMKFVSEEKQPTVIPKQSAPDPEGPVVIFDVEVYPNLFVVCWKYAGSDVVVRMINPSALEIEQLIQLKLVGFYNRDYDNHILYAASMGYTREKLYELSKNLTSTKKGGTGPKYTFGAAYNLSYADIYEFSSVKQGLKKWMIDLGLYHLEMDIPWDEPVADDMIEKVVEYCVNDVNATDALFRHLSQDFTARKILAELSGLQINEKTQTHFAKIVFGSQRNPQDEFVYTDLSKEFPGYEFDKFAPSGKKSAYRFELVGEGGYVYAEPGMHHDVALLDVGSMHPTSIHMLNAFGPYTEKFWALVQARLAIKHAHEQYKEGDVEKAEAFLDVAREMFDGKLVPYLEDIESAEKLGYALKIAVNIVYGMTAAHYPNAFKDPDNIDNIIAKRGALFMVDLKYAVQEQGFTVAHIKTDSIKIPNATPEIIKFVIDFGKKYGYTFEHEETYKTLCLVNDAVYIAMKGVNKKTGSVEYEAVGAEFKDPYIFKTLFSQDPITFDDLCQTKMVKQGVMYLASEDDCAEILAKPKKDEEKAPLTQEDLTSMTFIGRVGRFVPVTKESGGRLLLRVYEGKTYAVSNTKGYYWAEANTVKAINEIDMPFFDVATAHKPGGFEIDMKYFEKTAKEAKATVDKFGEGYKELIPF